MAHCAISIAPSILKLYEKLLNNIINWKSERYFDISSLKKVTGNFKTPKKAQK